MLTSREQLARSVHALGFTNLMFMAGMLSSLEDVDDSAILASLEIY